MSCRGNTAASNYPTKEEEGKTVRVRKVSPMRVDRVRGVFFDWRLPYANHFLQNEGK